MGSIVIDVMLKSEILDPQGQAVRGALPRLGFSGFTDVRQGKRFVLTVDDDVTEEHLAAAREAAEKLLSNPVIEDVVSVRAQDGDVVAAEGEQAEGEQAEGEQAEDEDSEQGDSAEEESSEEPSEEPDASDEDEGEQ